PRPANFFAVSGVTATRVSPASVSLGAPTRMTFPQLMAWALNWARAAGLEHDAGEAEQDEQARRQPPAKAGQGADRRSGDVEDETDQRDEGMALEPPKHQQQDNIEDVDRQIFGQADETGVGLFMRRQIDPEVDLGDARRIRHSL